MSETSQPAISVIIPVFNAAQFLDQTLSSLEAQTFRNFEYIFVDDDSTDNSLEILQTFAQQSSRPVTVLTQKNSGAGVARNRGMAKAKGVYLSILDADDFYEPTMLERAYHKACDDRADVVVFGSDEYLSDEHRYVPTPWTINQNIIPPADAEPFAGTDIKRNIFEAFLGWSWDKLIRTQFVRDNHLEFQDLRSSEDAFFCFMIIVRAERISTIREVFVHHRNYQHSLSHRREESWDCFYYALKQMRDQLKAWKLYRRFEQDFINYALVFANWHLTTISGPAYDKLYHKLQDEWWEDLEVTKHPADYFYNSYQYELYQKMMSCTPEEFLFYLRQNAEQVIRERDLELEALRNSTSWKLGQALVTPLHKAKHFLGRVKAKLLS